MVISTTDYVINIVCNFNVMVIVLLVFDYFLGFPCRI